MKPYLALLPLTASCAPLGVVPLDYQYSSVDSGVLDEVEHLEDRIDELEHQLVDHQPPAVDPAAPAPEEHWVLLVVAVISAITARYGDRAAKATWQKVKRPR